MSSVQSQRALLLALGGVSIAALFVWYIQSKETSEKKKANERLKKELSVPTEKVVTNGTKAQDSSSQDTKQNTASEPEEANPDSTTSEPTSLEKNDSEPIEEENNHRMVNAAESEDVAKKSDSESVQQSAFGAGGDAPAPCVEAEENDSMENNVDSANDTNADVEKNDIIDVVVVLPPTTASENEQNEQESTPLIEEEAMKQLVLDCTHTPIEHEQFSWSEEMERSFLDDSKHHTQGYEQSESPGVQSHSSEVSSQDSGRATGGLASSLSPMDDGMDNLPMYEFEIPNSLVGLIIGIKGKTIKELSTRTDVKMLIRQHYQQEKADTHQICQVRGKRDQINRCLQMLRRRFPPARFPELNLQPILPPPIPTTLFDAFSAQPCWLTLPEEVPCEVACSSIMSPSHFFLQQPTHPSFPSLAHLDLYMLTLYSQSGSTIPELPKPCQNGLLCAAPVLNAWFRAVTCGYYEETDEVLLRFVDYGGYSTVPRADLRQIRTDLMSLPFQSIECYLAHVQPVDGTLNWSSEAHEYFTQLVANKIITANLIGVHSEQKVHMVELTTTDENGKSVRIDRALMEAGFAKASDPSKMNPVHSTVHGKRAPLKSQPSVPAS